jgi:hypothetical protein
MSRKAGTPNKKKELHAPTFNGNPFEVEKFHNDQNKPGEIMADGTLREWKPPELDYIILSENNQLSLVDSVIRYMREGMACQGGVSVTCYRDVNGIEFVYCQAMIRKE